MDSIGSTSSQPINVGDQEPQSNANSLPSNVRPPTNPKSNIFGKYYTKFFDNDGTLVRAKCNFCEKSYAFKMGSGYGTLNKHMEKVHPQEVGLQKSQTQLTGYAQQSSSSSSLNLFKFTEQKWRDALARFVCTKHLPFTFGEDENFIRLIQENANPQVKRTPRTTLTRDIKRIYKNDKIALVEYFTKLKSRVSICSDIWSDHWQVNSYMGITCHWIDENWLLQKRIIAFRVFNDSHTADNISKLISTILQEYNLIEKIFSIGFDNASSNTASIDDLKNACTPIIGGKFFHIRCACHILNLSVQKGLTTLDKNVKPIKDAIKYLMGRPTLVKQWSTYCKTKGKVPKRFKHDVPTRWNSTYDVLCESLKYRTLLDDFFSSLYIPVKMTQIDWNNCVKLVQVLKIFKDATLTFSRVYTPTSHLFLYQACNIVGVLKDNIIDPCLKESITNMLNKWLDYYKEIPLLYLVAAVLDPRSKMVGLEKYINRYYDLITLCFPFSDYYTSLTVSNYTTNTRNIINELYNEYSTFYNRNFTSSTTNTNSSQDTITSNPIFPFTKVPDGQEIFQMLKKQKCATNSELEEYLTTSFDFSDNKFESDSIEDFKILEWWNKKTSIFPILSMIAKEILAAPVSTVAVEQAFSMGGNILDEKRSRMTYESLEIQALVDDWTKANVRNQNIELDEEFDLDITVTGDSSVENSPSHTYSEEDNDD